MSTSTSDDGGFIANFLDKIWHQAILATVITVLWLIWIFSEILGG